MYFNGALEGIEGLSCLSLTSITALGFRDLLVNLGGALGKGPPSVNVLELGHEAFGTVLRDACGASFFGEHGDDRFLPDGWSVG